jgi:hypothetical protein
MKGATFTINAGLDAVLEVQVTDYYVQRPLGRNADSDWDCYGYTDLEWKVLGGVAYEEDGTETILTLAEAEALASDYSEDIDSEILSEVDSAKDDDF